jgi:histidine triad (HIT) family protein
MSLVLVVCNPVPSYPLHILILPKAKYRSLKDLPSDGSVFESSLFKAVKELAERFDLDGFGYRLIANGGSAQEIDHLHFHLVSDKYEGEFGSST